MIWTSAVAAELYTLISSCYLVTTVLQLIKMALPVILDSWMRKKWDVLHHILVNDLLEACN